jgi:hypothetical protein
VILRLLIALGAALLACTPAAAHTRSQSFSSWNTDDNTLTGVYQVAAQRATQLGTDGTPDSLESLLAAHLAQTVSVRQGDARCAARSPRPLTAARGDLRVELAYACPAPLAETPATVSIGAFFDVSPSHVHYARVAREGGQAREVLATVRSHSFEAGGPDSAASTDFPAFVRLGTEHVLSGVDHLAFLAALALLAGSLGRIVWAVTGFTLGHSLTLGLVALGWLSPNVRAVEALIGFTVAFAACEALTSRREPGSRTGWLTLALVAAVPVAAKLAGASMLPWLVTGGIAAFALGAGGLGGAATRRGAPLLALAFGLAHGAGFAGALLDLDIPRERLLVALLGFNVGVEAGQLLALAVLGALAVVATRLPGAFRQRSLDYASAGLFALGVFWFVERSVALG